MTITKDTQGQQQDSCPTCGSWWDAHDCVAVSIWHICPYCSGGTR